MNKDEHPFFLFILCIVVFIGVWEIYAQFSVYFAFNFNFLVKYVWVPGLISIVIIHFVRRAGDDNACLGAPPPQTAHPAAIYLAAAAVLGAVVSPFVGGYTLFWIPAVSYLLLHFGRFLWRSDIQQPVGAHSPHRFPLVTSLIVAGLAVCTTLLVNRPDADDALYLNIAVSALDHGTLPLMRLDGMHGEANVPFLQSVYKPQTYELLIATVSHLTSLPVATVYYVAFPSIFAAAFAFAHALVLRRLIGNHAHIGLIVTFIVILVWGEGHRVFGNFAFVRLFQGKAVFVSVMVPLIVYFALRFTDRPGWQRWLPLFLAQIAAVAFTSTAAVVAPVAAGLAILAGVPRPDRRWRVLLAGASASSHAVGTALLLWLDAQAEGPTFFTGVILDLSSVIGAGLRGSLALVAVMLVPALSWQAGLASAGWLSRYVLLSLVILLNPFLVPMIGQDLVGAMSWRLYWAIPFPMLIGVAATAALLLIWDDTQRRRWLFAAASSVVAVLFLTSGRWTLAANNGVRFSWADLKVDPIAYEAATGVVAATPENGLVLAPPAVSAVLAGIHGAPPLVSVRIHYLEILVGHWGADEARSREALTRFVDGQDDGSMVAWVLVEIARRGVTTVVIPSGSEFDAGFIDGLHQQGFQKSQAGGFDIWSLREANRG